MCLDLIFERVITAQLNAPNSRCINIVTEPTKQTIETKPNQTNANLTTIHTQQGKCKRLNKPKHVRAFSGTDESFYIFYFFIFLNIFIYLSVSSGL